MQSFRTELENPVVEKDILELEQKIRLFQSGKTDPDRFRTLRLARGVYGQRQPGVQMIRIKIPFGELTAHQLRVIADISDEYSNGHLHLTTRQDVQIHYVSLDHTPELWARLEQSDITLREACGNTVRNITASAEAGIDADEPFDVTPYAHALFRYFLRKPFGQELGRKIKIAFSSSEKDTAWSFIHDLGFIPKISTRNGVHVYGFKVMIAGGLGAQPFLAQVAAEFLPAEDLLLFTESVIRVFDRYGERNNRNKARLKYLVQKSGLEEFLKQVEAEKQAVDISGVRLQLREELPLRKTDTLLFEEPVTEDFRSWKKSNVRLQKQPGFAAVYIRVPLGNISSAEARHLADITAFFSAERLRITINQGFILRFVPVENIPALYSALNPLGFAQPGFDSVADITACPGTDTCNLGISNSTAVALELERVVEEEFPDLVYERQLKIKISGCMNSCGQHGLAHIGFHGSSFKVGQQVAPALQVMLGGGALCNGEGRAAERVIKIPARRAPAVVRVLLHDFAGQSEPGEHFIFYYQRKGKDYFYRLLKPLGNTDNLEPGDYIDWGAQEKFETAIGVGECAGVMIDLVQTLLLEADEKIIRAYEALAEERRADAIYYAYSAIIHAAKGLLTAEGIQTNTQISVLKLFDEHIGMQHITLEYASLEEMALQINSNPPSGTFARAYLAMAKNAVQKIKEFRKKQLKKTITEEVI